MSDKSSERSGSDPRVLFARSATRHRISKDSSRHVIANYRLRFEQPPPARAPVRSTRIVFLGEDQQGHPLEIMAVQGEHGELLVIHAMRLREKYRKRHEGEL